MSASEPVPLIDHHQLSLSTADGEQKVESISINVVDEQSNNYQQKGKNIDLSDQMHAIKEKYEHNYKTFYILLPLIVLYSLVYSQNVWYKHLPHQMIVHYLIMATCGTIIVISIFLVLYGCRSKLSYPQYLNSFLGIKYSPNKFDLHIKYYGGYILCTTMYIFGARLLLSFIYADFETIWTENGCSDDQADDLIKTACDAVASTMDPCSYIGICLLSLHSFRTLSSKSLEKIANLHKQYEGDKIDRILDKFRLKDNKPHFSLKPAIAFFVFNILCMAVDIVSASVEKNIWCIIFILLNSILKSIFFVYVYEYYLHFKFPRIIMNELSLQFNAKNIDDIIEWWTTRKYYINCFIRFHTKSLKYVLAALILGSMLLSVHYLVKQNNGSIGINVSSLFITLLLVEDAVVYHQYQLAHSNTINQEELRLIHINNGQSDVSNSLIQHIITDIKENSSPINVFGVRMTSKFMLFLRTSVFALFMAYFIQS